MVFQGQGRADPALQLSQCYLGVDPHHLGQPWSPEEGIEVLDDIIPQDGGQSYADNSQIGSTTLRKEIEDYYKDAPGGLDKAIEEAQKHQAKGDAMGLPTWTPKNVDREIPLVLVDAKDLGPKGSGVAGVTLGNPLSGPDKSISVAAVPGFRAEGDAKKVIEHEITHAALNADGGTQLGHSLRHNLEPVAPYDRPSADVPKGYWDYAAKPDKLKAYAADLKRDWVKATGRQLDSPEAAEDAIRWGLQRQPGTELQKAQHKLYKSLDANPQAKPFLKQMLLQVVQGDAPDTGVKMAELSRYECPHCGGTNAFNGDPETGAQFRGSGHCQDCNQSFSIVARKLKPIDQGEVKMSSVNTPSNTTPNTPFTTPNTPFQTRKVDAMHLLGRKSISPLREVKRASATPMYLSQVAQIDTKNWKSGDLFKLAAALTLYPKVASLLAQFSDAKFSPQDTARQMFKLSQVDPEIAGGYLAIVHAARSMAVSRPVLGSREKRATGTPGRASAPGIVLARRQMAEKRAINFGSLGSGAKAIKPIAPPMPGSGVTKYAPTTPGGSMPGGSIGGSAPGMM